MKFGSVCSGIEAASVAWHPLGWEAAWLSEIEPFPSAVLAHHYPEVPNLGDMTTLPDRILSGDVEAPDLFCGGTPCQAFSVAGLRNSLDDARGNLSLTFVGIANAIDHVRSVRGDSPAIIFWENVPGVLSTKDNAFGCFLGALAGEDGAVVPSGEKWTNAGCVYGPQRAVAWRVLDAQYFGVAQRRRRVFVVASARDNFNPAEVLFEFQGVRRDIAPRREAGQRIAPCVTNGPPFSRTGNERVKADAMIPVTSYTPSSIGGYREGVGTLRANGGDIGGGSENLVTMLDQQGHLLPSWWDGGQVAATITTKSDDQRMPDKANAQLVMQPTYAIQGSMIGRNDNAGPQGDGINVELCFTQNTIDRHAIAQPIAYSFDSLASNSMKSSNPHSGCNPVDVSRSLDTSRGLDPSCNQGGIGVAQPINFGAQMSVPQVDFDLCQTLQAKNPMAVAQPVGFTRCDHGGDAVIDGTPTMRCGSNYSAHLAASIPYIGGVDYENNAHTMDQPTGPLLKGSPTGGGRPLPAIATAMQVRRLTPVECERLQGFPDGYTNIPWRKAAESPDGPRYKALGNSWAVPVVHWIGKRIQAQLTK